MRYRISGGRVSSYIASNTRTWLSASGWREMSHSLNHRSVLGGGAEARTYAHMRNSTFCAGKTTNVYYPISLPSKPHIVYFNQTHSMRVIGE